MSIPQVVRFCWVGKLEKEAQPLIPLLIPPLHFTESEMGNSAENLTKLLIERIDPSPLKQDLRKLCPSEVDRINRMGSLKTLARWLKQRAHVSAADQILSPLFVLYDLRVLYKHLVPEEQRESKRAACVTRLQLPTDADDRLLYEAVLDRTSESLTSLEASLRSGEGQLSRLEDLEQGPEPDDPGSS